MNYPGVVLFRYSKYADIDAFIESKTDDFLCTFTIISDCSELNKLYNSNWPLLVTYGPDETEYYADVNRVICDRMRRRWIHYKSLENINDINNGLNYCYMSLVKEPAEDSRVTFSLFTTCYNSYEKIKRAYKSIQLQTFLDWEWVIIDDSPDDAHFGFLCNLFKGDYKVRLYKRSSNSGNIGDVKNEAVSLCRGKYVLEMDHDDEILPDVIKDAVAAFETDPTVGFVYMDFANLYEGGANFKYCDCYALGYASYYMQKYQGKWIFVSTTPNINNITLSHIVSVPNHPRIWRKSTLMEIGNYSEWLPIADDYELLLRTAIHKGTKIAKVHKLGYIQYMNHGNNNFSLIRNKEINRLVPKQIKPHYYNTFQINEKMRELDAYEDPEKNRQDSWKCLEIWKRPGFEYKFCNTIINPDFKKQYCIIGLPAFYENLEKWRELYLDRSNDFILLDTDISYSILTNQIDALGFSRMKCYSIDNHSVEDLRRFFLFLYKSCEDYEIYESTSMCKEQMDLKLLEDAKEYSMNNDMYQKVTIITPCIRPENLDIIIKTIDFSVIKEWIIVYDGKKISENPRRFSNHEYNRQIREVVHYDPDSTSGNSQRNYGLSLLSEPTSVYFVDDDNTVHPELYSLLPFIEKGCIYTFNQKRPDTVFPYKSVLKGNYISRYHMDTAMFIVDSEIIKNTGIQWKKDAYNADGIFIEDCYRELFNILGTSLGNTMDDRWIFIDRIMANYNGI
jgi:glycosyltransferase involved in cell wall biosynthesis